MFLRPVIAMVVSAVLIYGLWMLLNGYFAPHKAAGKRELIQSMALIVGGVVAFGTLFVSYRNLRHSQETALSTQQNTQAALEEQRELDEGRRQDEALQTYLGQMSQLLTDKELRRTTDWLDEARITARVQSLTVLSRLGGERKRSVLQFLYEAQLINRRESTFVEGVTYELGPARIVGLSGVDLRSADLRYIYLSDAALNGALLDNADLREAKLRDIDLGGAYLSGADLRGADLSGADLSGADLSGADLRGARGLTQEQIDLTIGSNKAELPEGFNRPQWWSKGIEEQRRIVQESEGWVDEENSDPS